MDALTIAASIISIVALIIAVAALVQAMRNRAH